MKAKFILSLIICCSVSVAATLWFSGALTKTESESNKLGQLEAANKELTEANKALKEKLSKTQEQADEAVANAAADVAVQVEEAVAEIEEAKQEEPSMRRMMRSVSKMMDNPAMNKMMEASQRGALSAMYEDLLKHFELNPEEEKYFMDLLVSRQMVIVDGSMKMMSGSLNEEEQAEFKKKMEEAGNLTKEEMEYFLNNPEDYEEWEFYENTLGERMMLSQVKHNLSGTPNELDTDTERTLLEMMSEEKKNYDFSGDLHDNENVDMSSDRFSKENIDSFGNDMRGLNEQMIKRAEEILTPEQLTLFTENMRAALDMQIAQMEMAGQMFGGK